MANGFDITDPTQLEVNTEPTPTYAEMYPTTSGLITQPTLTPAEIAIEEEAKRLKTLEYVNAYRDYGLDDETISRKIGSLEGFDETDVRATMWAQYEVDRAKTLEAHESRLKEHEENEAAKDLRMQQLTDSLKKKDTTSEPGGGPPLFGSDLTGEEEAKELAELSEDERFDAYFNKYTTPEGVKTADHIRLTGVNDSLAKDARHISYSEALLRYLTDGNIEDAEETLYYMEQDGVDIIGEYDLENPEEIERLKRFAVDQRKKALENSKAHMGEVKSAYGQLGIEYDYNPESEIDLRDALLEANKLKSRLDSSTEAHRDAERIEQEAMLDYAMMGVEGGGGWFARRAQALGNWVQGTTTQLGSNLMAIYYDYLKEDNDTALEYAKRSKQIDMYSQATRKIRDEASGMDERHQRMGLWETMMDDKSTWGDVGIKAANTFEDVLPDVAFATATMGTGALIKKGGKEAIKAGSKGIMAKYFGTESARQASAKIVLGNTLTYGTSASFGLRSAGSTYASVIDRKDMSLNEKMFLATVVGTAEATLTYMFMGAEKLGAQGVRGMLGKSGADANIKAAMKEALKGAGKREAFKKFGKGVGGEWLEEASIEAIDQGTRYLLDWSNGREPEQIDYYAIMDAGLAGLLGAGPMSLMGATSSYISHSAVAGRQDVILEEIERLDNTISRTKDPKILEGLEAERKRAYTMLALNQNKGQKEYAKLNQEEREEVNALNRNLANLGDEIRVEKDNDTKKQLEEQYESLLKRKVEVEEGAKDRQPVEDSAVAFDKDGNEVVTESKDVTSEQKEENDAARKANDSEIEADKKTQEEAPGERLSRGVRESTPQDIHAQLEEILDNRYKCSVTGDCVLAANDVVELLEAQGIPHKIVSGLIETNKMFKAGEKGPKTVEHRELHSHVWIELSDGTKVDLSESQFNNEGGIRDYHPEGGKHYSEITKEQLYKDFSINQMKEAESREEAVPPELEDSSVTLEADQGVDFGAEWVGSGPGKIAVPILNQINKLKKAFGGVIGKHGIKVQIHLTPESFKKATGASSFGMYIPSTKTIHLQPKSKKADVQEEFGHAVFRTLMNTNGKLRDSIYKELANMNGGISFNDNGTIKISPWIKNFKKDKNGRVISDSVEFTSPEAEAEVMGNNILRILIDTELSYIDKENAAERQEEAIMSMLTAYAKNPDQFNNPKGKGIIGRIMRMINKAMKVGGYKGNYITSQEDFFSLASKFKEATEGVETEVETKAEDYLTKQPGESDADFNKRVEEETDRQLGESVEGKMDTFKDRAGERGLESRKGVIRPNLDNTEVYYTQSVWMDATWGAVSQLSSSRYKSVTVSDYWHFHNLYAKLTGNGAEKSRMEDMFYVKDGVKYPLEPPSPKRDRKTKEILEMPIPYRETYRGRQARLKSDEMETKDALSQQRSALLKEVGDLYTNNEKKISSYTNMSDFSPVETSMIPETETSESVLTEMEGLVIAKKNLQALIDSELTAEDLEALADENGGHIFKTRNPEIFNMSGLTPFSEAQDGDAFGQETTPDVEGLEAREMVLDQRSQPKLKENRGNIQELKGMLARVFGYDRTKEGSGVRPLMNKTIKWGDRDATVITAHRDVEVTDIVMADLIRMVEQEIANGNYDKETGIGYIATMEALLKDESSLGNPTVFEGIIDKYGSKETFEKALNARNKEGKLTDAAKTIRREIRIGASNLGIRGEQLVDAMYMDDISLDELQVSQIKEILKPNKGLDKKSFKRRTLIAKKMLSKEQRQEVYKEVNDSAWDNVKTAEVVAYTKIPFKVDPTAPKGFTGFRVAKEEPKRGGKKVAFSGLIIEDGTIDEKPQLKIVEELFSIPELFPGMTINIGEDVDVPMAELSAEDQMKQASTLAGISQVRGRLFAKANDITLKEGETIGGVKYTGETATDTEDATTTEVKAYHSRGSTIEGETDNGTFQLREKTWFQEWRGKWLRRLADKYRDVLMIQEDIEKHQGIPVKESQDFKMAEERMYGKAAYDLEKLEAKTKELTALMKDLGITQGELSDYLYALHAKERNALILERDGKEDGSGMTDAEADAIINEMDPAQKANLDSTLKIVREIQQDTRDAMVEFGLESQETIDIFEGQFDNYVPLAGIALDEADSGSSLYPTGGAGLSVQGDTYKKATGRKSKAGNLLAQVIAQNASVHIAGRTNEALQSLHELVAANPNKKVWTVIDTASFGDNHLVPVRVNGEQKFIRFADSSYAETLKGMSVPRTSALVKMLRAPASWLRRSFTTLNPEFVISNFSRDIQSAIFNAVAESEIEGGALLGKSAVKDMLKMVGPSLKALLKINNPSALGKLFKENPLIEKYYTEFQEDGGKTGWAYAKPLADIAAEIEKETTDRSTAQNILGKAEDFADAIEGVNDAFENSIRLSTYIAARENGVSRGKAAQLAKSITVNFNKHGEYGQALNAVYLFFNASIQGTMRLGKSLLGSKPARPDGVKESWMKRRTNAQKIASGLVVFSGMLTMIARAMSDEDEDGILYYDKIPDYVKERNLIFMFDGENYIKVPMPYGYNIFANLGTAAVETTQGAKEVDEALLFLANSFMGAFSPVSFGQSKDLFTSIGKSATPTVLKPLVEIMTNETYFGGPVYAAQSPYASPKPESSMSFRSPKAIQEFFEWINETTGGSKHVPGNVDMNPDKFWHIFEYYLGGAGQFVTRSGETSFKVGQKLTKDNDIKVEFNDVPLLRKMYGEPSKYYDFEKFKEREDEIKQLVREYKQDRSEDLSRYEDLGRLNKTLKTINKQLKNIRARKREARDINNYAERSVRIQELMDKERSLIMKFNRVYDKIRNNE